MKFENMAGLIYDYRGASKLTQLELSQRLGYSTAQFISNIERGKCTFPTSKFKKLSKILKIDAQLLVDAYMCDIKEQLNREVLGVAYGKK